MIVFPQEVTCALCGASSNQQVILSASGFGACDLDTRMPGGLGKAIEYQVHECPACGYCAQDLSVPAGNLRSFVSDPRYRAKLENPVSPRLANRYTCVSLIAAARGDFFTAGWASVRAAWACDDAGASFAAVACRNLAVEWFGSALEGGRLIISEAGGTGLLLADLLRRAGRFDEAVDQARAALAQSPDETFRRLLLFELELAGRQDVDSHSTAEIEEKSHEDDRS